MAQTVTMEKGGHYDRPRILRAAVFGAFILGPLAHTHYNFIEWLTVKKVGTFSVIILEFLPVFLACVVRDADGFD